MTSTQLMRPAHRLLHWFGVERPVQTQQAPNRGFHFRYDADGDLLLARLGEPEPCDNVQVDDNVVVRVSRETHDPVGIEVVAVSERFHKSPSAINRAFAKELLAQFGPEAASRVRRRLGAR